MGSQESKQTQAEAQEQTDLLIEGMPGQFRAITRGELTNKYIPARLLNEEQKKLRDANAIVLVPAFKRAPDGKIVFAENVYTGIGRGGIVGAFHNERMRMIIADELRKAFAGSRVEADAIATIDATIDAVRDWATSGQDREPTEAEVASRFVAARIMNALNENERERVIRAVREAVRAMVKNTREHAREHEGSRVAFSGGYLSHAQVLGSGTCPYKEGGAPAETESQAQLTSIKKAFLDKVAQSRASLVERLISILGNVLPAKAIPSTGTTNERMHAISAFLTSKRATPESAGAFCEKLTHAINEVFGMTVIDPISDPAICATQIADVIDALSHDVGADFYLLGIDIVRDIRNLEALVGALKVWRNAVPEKYEAADAREIITPLDDIIREFERYTTMMRARIDRTFVPSFPGVLASMAISKNPRDSTLASKIDAILRNIHTTASTALAVQNALATIGMDLDEFKTIKDGRAFWELFTKLVNDKVIAESDDADGLFAAAQYVARNVGRGEEIERILAAHSGARTGGAPRKADPANAAIDRATAMVKRRNIIINAYGQALQAGIVKIFHAVDALSRVIGTAVPLGPQLEHYRNLLNQLSEIQMESPRVHLALISFYTDAAAGEVRAHVLDVLRAVAGYSESIASETEYVASRAQFDTVRDAANELIAAIDQATENVRAITGGLPASARVTPKSDEEEMNEHAPVEGGAPTPITAIRDVIIRDKIRMTDAIERMNYMVRVAQLRANLEAQKAEFPMNVKSYDTNVLGPAVAARITKLNQGRDYVLRQLGMLAQAQGAAAQAPDANSFNGAQPAVAQQGAQLIAGEFASLVRPATIADIERTPGGRDTREFVTEYYAALVRFWESVQAIELYLKYFTEALIGHPDEVKEIALMIREVDVIAQMYDNSAGDEVARIFESNFATAVPPQGAHVPKATTDGDFMHWTGIGAYPFSGLISEKFHGLIATTSARLSKYLALKNLISFFVHFGSKIGGKALRDITPRSPAEIYRDMINFLAISSYAFGFRNNITQHMHWDINTGTFAAGIGAGLNDGQIAVGPNSSAQVIMRPVLQEPGQNIAPFDPATGLDLRIENETFAAVIKSLGAKILVLSGMSDLLTRPHELHTSRASVRMIIGAGPESIPKVEDKVTELYLRMPLLALFYKKFFASERTFGQLREGTNARIVLLPDVGGSEFGTLIRLIFRKFPHADTQFFTDNEMAQLIVEINRIYAHFAKGADARDPDIVRKILGKFIETMSRMVYIISPEDQTKYNQQFGARAGIAVDETMRETYDTEGAPLTDIDILGSEGDVVDAVPRPVPSDPIVEAEGAGRTADARDPFVVHAGHWKLVRKFRCMIDDALAKPNTVSLRGNVETAQTKLAQTPDDAERFALICGLVRGTGASTVIDNMRKVLFLEVMGTGLGMLSAMYSIVRMLQISAYVSCPARVSEAARVASTQNLADTDAVIGAISNAIADELYIRGDTTSDTVVRTTLELAMGYLGVAPQQNAIQWSSNRAQTRTLSVANGALQEVDGAGAARNLTSPAQYMNYETAMGLLLESVVTCCSKTNELVRAELSEGHLIVDFGRMSEYVGDFIKTLEAFVGATRAHIDPAIVKRYVDKKTPGSLYWLDEQFREKLTLGRMTDGAQKYKCTFADLSRTIREAFDGLTSKVKRSPEDANESYVDYSRTFARIIAHGAAGLNAPGLMYKRAQVLSDPFDALLMSDVTGEKMIDTRYLESLSMTGNDAVYQDSNNGILFAFNKLVMMLMRQTFDPASGKLYKGVIDPFVNGAFNDAILHEDHTFVDILPNYWIESGRVRDITTRVDIDTSAPTEYNKGTFLDQMYAYAVRVKGFADTVSGDFAGEVKTDLSANSKYLIVQDAQGQQGMLHRAIADMVIGWMGRLSDIHLVDAVGTSWTLLGQNAALDANARTFGMRDPLPRMAGQVGGAWNSVVVAAHQNGYYLLTLDPNSPVRQMLERAVDTSDVGSDYCEPIYRYSRTGLSQSALNMGIALNVAFTQSIPAAQVQQQFAHRTPANTTLLQELDNVRYSVKTRQIPPHARNVLSAYACSSPDLLATLKSNVIRAVGQFAFGTAIPDEGAFARMMYPERLAQIAANLPLAQVQQIDPATAGDADALINFAHSVFDPSLHPNTVIDNVFPGVAINRKVLAKLIQQFRDNHSAVIARSISEREREFYNNLLHGGFDVTDADDGKDVRLSTVIVKYLSIARDAQLATPEQQPLVAVDNHMIDQYGIIIFSMLLEKIYSKLADDWPDLTPRRTVSELMILLVGPEGTSNIVRELVRSIRVLNNNISTCFQRIIDFNYAAPTPEMIGSLDNLGGYAEDFVRAYRAHPGAGSYQGDDRSDPANGANSSLDDEYTDFARNFNEQGKTATQKMIAYAYRAFHQLASNEQYAFRYDDTYKYRVSFFDGRAEGPLAGVDYTRLARNMRDIIYLFYALHIVADMEQACPLVESPALSQKHDTIITEAMKQIMIIASDPNVQLNGGLVLLRDLIFDGYLPRDVNDLKYAGGLLSAISRKIGSHGKKSLLARAQINPANALPADVLGRLREGRGTPDDKMRPWNSGGMGDGSLPPIAVTPFNATVETRANIKHIITPKEYRQAVFEMRPQYQGTFIVYPGDYRATDADYGDLRAYHGTLYRGTNMAATPDQFMSRPAFDPRVTVDGQHVLFASIAYMLRNALSSHDRHGVYNHLHVSAADIPVYMREKYRAYLPYFRAAFSALADKCTFYRRIIDAKPECFSAQDDALGLTKSLAPVGMGRDKEKVAPKLLSVLKSVEVGASDLIRGCNETLSAIGDSRKQYFETSQGSIDAYVAQNGHTPIMPLSAMLRVIMYAQSGAMRYLAPKFGFGEPEFKLSYAIRGFYDYRANVGARGMDASAMVGTVPPIVALDSLIATFNKFSLGNFKISQKLAQDLTRGLTGGFDFLRDVRYDKIYTTSMNPSIWLEYARVRQDDDQRAKYVASVGVQNSIIRADNYNSAHPNREIAVLSNKEQPIVRPYMPVPTPFGMSAQPIDIANVVENRARDDAIKMIVTRTMPSDMRETDVILANIVDINMVPFDIHVLTRQMPLHFIWNYAFTFDTIAGSMIYDKMQPSALMRAYFTGCRDDPRTGAVPADGTDGGAPYIVSARDAMFAMISDPYRTLTIKEKQWVMRMLAGAHGIPGFARPKFLGDQLVGKVLYGHLYGRTTQPEVGPPSIQVSNNIDKLANVFTNQQVLAQVTQLVTSFDRAIQSGSVRQLNGVQKTNCIKAFVLTIALADPYHNANLYAQQQGDAIASQIANDVCTRMMDANGAVISIQDRDRLKELIKSEHDIANVAKVLVRFVFETYNFALQINFVPPTTFYDIREDAISMLVRKIINEWKPIVVTQVAPASAVWRQVLNVQIQYPLYMSAISFATSTDEYGMEIRSAIAQPQHGNVIGAMRMDTVLVRNLMHIGLVLEVVQARLARDLTYMTGDRVAEATGSIDPSIYKLFGTQAQPDARAPNYEGRNFI